MKYANHMRATPQSRPLPLRDDQIKNAAGGYVFQVSDWTRFRRFLILGTEGGTFYEGEKKLTIENAQCVKRCVIADGTRAIAEIVEVSDKGLAVKNDPAIFALAIASKFGDEDTRRLAFASLKDVCRIGTHLFQFIEAREAIGGGWGRGMTDAVCAWYDRPDLVLQTLKYQSRNGWSHRDVLRLAHPQTKDEGLNGVFKAITKSDWKLVDVALAQGWVEIQSAVDAHEAARLIERFQLPRELVPTQWLTDAVVWEALLPHMGLGALTRNLGNLSKSGLLKPLSEASKTVQRMICNAEAIRKARLHPFQILLALKVYGQGRSVKGSGVWTPVPQVVDALDEAFYAAFQFVPSTGKRFILGVDVSGSMGGTYSGISTVLTPAEAAAAMAMVTARTESDYFIGGFSTQFKDLGITAKNSLADVLKKTRDQNFGGTDTAVLIKYALKHRIDTDAVVIYTDNETWAGETHTCEVMRQYRKHVGHDVKLAVVGFTATGRSIADPNDLSSMDFTGMDSSLPAALRSFVIE